MQARWVPTCVQHCADARTPPPQVRELVAQANALSAAAEDLTDENAALRAKAGLPPRGAGGAADVAGTAGVRSAREVTLAQLRSVNAMLERQARGKGGCCALSAFCPWTPGSGHLRKRCCHCCWPHWRSAAQHSTAHTHTRTPFSTRPQVSDLEEERRKLRLELKFRAKYHGRWGARAQRPRAHHCCTAAPAAPSAAAGARLLALRPGPNATQRRARAQRRAGDGADARPAAAAGGVRRGPARGVPP